MLFQGFRPRERGLPDHHHGKPDPELQITEQFELSDGGPVANAHEDAAQSVVGCPLHLDDSSVSTTLPSCSSSPTSTSGGFPEGDFENADSEYVRDIKSEVMANWLHAKQEERIWTNGQEGEGVFLKKYKGNFVCCPTELQMDSSGVYQAISLLNARVGLSPSYY